MEPVFMYWSKIKFKGGDNFKEFRVNFSDNDRLNGVLFKKEKDYFITSLTANIRMKTDLKKLKDYKKIEEISKKSNEIIKKGTSNLYKIELMKTNLNGIEELSMNNNKRKFAEKTLEIIDKDTEKKKKVSFY